MTGKHGRHRPRWMYLVTGVVGALGLIGALFLGAAAPAGAVIPGQDACHATNNSAPQGDCGSFHQLYRETFSTNAPYGTFSGCGGDGDFQCAGAVGTRYYTTLGAYPDGWPDTANPENHSNGNNRTFGGYYRPQDTMHVIRSGDGKDGKLRIHMWRPSSGGSNHVAAPVPLKCMDLRYGKFTERLAVWSPTDGYKMAHLHYSPDEIDYPEAGGNFASDPVSAFTHGFSETSTDVASNSAWKHYHTYSQEITPGHVKIYFDNKLIRDISGDYPRATPWVLQEESALAGGYAAKGSYSNTDITWLTCYSYTG